MNNLLKPLIRHANAKRYFPRTAREASSNVGPECHSTMDWHSAYRGVTGNGMA